MVADCPGREPIAQFNCKWSRFLPVERGQKDRFSDGSSGHQVLEHFEFWTRQGLVADDIIPARDRFSSDRSMLSPCAKGCLSSRGTHVALAVQRVDVLSSKSLLVRWCMSVNWFT